MLISPQHLSPGSLVTLQLTRAAASSGFRFIPPSVRATLPFSFLPRLPEAGDRAQLGTECVPNQSPSQSLPYSPVPLDQPLASFFFRALLSLALLSGSSTSSGWSRGPGPEGGCGIWRGGGWGVQGSPASGPRSAQLPGARCPPRPAPRQSGCEKKHNLFGPVDAS